MIDEFTISKIETIIPGFKKIKEEKQISFITSLSQFDIFHEWLTKNQYYSSDSTLASRQIQRKRMKRFNENFKHIVLSIPAFQEVSQAIIIKQIVDLGFDWSKFNSQEQNVILNLEYSRIPFPNNWLDLFFNDEQEAIKKIKHKLFASFYQEFGFLFLTQNLKFFFRIDHELSQIKNEDKPNKLIHFLNCDWGKTHPFISEITQPINHYFNDLFKPWTHGIKKYLDEMMSAHIFYRILGISSDNMIIGCSLETGLPYINAIDSYLYHTNRKSIFSLMTVWQTLFKPLRPFFYEYVELAESEKNIIKICVRAFMPFFIMSMVLALGYAAILPLAYHQLIEYIFFIPAFYFSIIVASQYIQLKNYLYLNLIQWYFGSVHKVHLYDETPSLIEAMQSATLAQEILKYYVKSLELCDTLEKTHQKKTYATLHQENLALKENLLNELNSFKKTDIKPESILLTIENRLNQDKRQTKIMIQKYYHLFSTLDEEQKEAFKKDYLFLKNKYQDICKIETQISDLTPQESHRFTLS